jgi:archaellum biogenesis ATPase FlaH
LDVKHLKPYPKSEYNFYMTSIHLEKIFFHYLLQNRELQSVVDPRFFESGLIKKVYELSKEFCTKYSDAPTRHQILELAKMQGLEETLSETNLVSLFDVNLTEYEEEWLKETTESWIEYKNLDTSIFDVISYLKTTKVTAENIKEIVSKVKEIVNERNSIEFGFDEGLDFFNPDSHLQPTQDTFTSGYSYLDLVLGGGFYSKALFCFIGEMKIGKSIWLANLAANSVREGHNTAVISLEMRDRKLIKRLGANLLGISMRDYADKSKDGVSMKKKLGNVGYDSLKVPGKLWVKEFPTSSAGVPDVEKYLKKMEETKGIKFKLIVLDYVNILKNWRNPNSENMYMKIKQIAEDLRAMAMRNEWAIVTATQVNRSGFGSTDLSITNISESSALGHTVDAMFGIIQDEIMHANREYTLKLLANRDDGYKNSRKKFLIDYDYMRITEDATTEIITE